VSFELNTPYAPTPDNRPEVLEHSPLALTLEGKSQMSFGERAALEGVLAQIRPRLAIEIGTAEGGSLARIVSYSAETHSIDLTHEPAAVFQDEHVIFHTGPSRQLLPELLDELTDSGRAVDFALVDGDHSFEGVANDLRTLLRSPSTARSVLLVHDSMNEEVRAGIESVGLDAYAKVVYYEPDFVPGYMYRQGTALNSVWGGLCLIICDTQRSPGYTSSPRQWRYYEPYEAIHRMRAAILTSNARDSHSDSDGISDERAQAERELRTRLAVVESELSRQGRALEVAYSSRSWMLTAPARAAAERVRARRSRRTQVKG
jgi:Methyltransferase domain